MNRESNREVRTVYVAAPQSNPANSLGIGSIILGAIAIPLACIPLVGFGSPILSGIGLILAVVGGIVSVSRGGQGIGFPIAGASLCVVNLAVYAAIVVVFAGAVAVIDEGVKATAKIQEIAEAEAVRIEAESAKDAAVEDLAGGALDAPASDPDTGTMVDEAGPDAAPIDAAPTDATKSVDAIGADESAPAQPPTVAADEAFAKAENDAEKAFALARKLMGKPETAAAGKRRMKEIAEKFPGTKAASKAAELVGE